MAKSQRVPRTRNGGTMTEAEFWQMLKTALRDRTRYWKPNAIVRKNAVVKSKGVNHAGKKMTLTGYRCSDCQKIFNTTDVQVDHISPVGLVKDPRDLNEFVERLFVEHDKLQLLCVPCHNRKSVEDKELIKNHRK